MGAAATLEHRGASGVCVCVCVFGGEEAGGVWPESAKQSRLAVFRPGVGRGGEWVL